MSEQLPITKITEDLYSVLADKTLSFGCKVRNNDSTDGEKIFLGRVDDDPEIKLNKKIAQYSVYQEKRRPCCFRGETLDSHSYTIIGHEPTLNDVLLKLSRENLIMNTYPAIDNEEILCVRYKSDVGWGRVIHYDLTKSFDHKDNEGMRRKLHDLICKK